MNFFKDMFPFIKLPTFSETSFVGSLCSCLRCNSLSSTNRGTPAECNKVSSQITTVTSLMNKIKSSDHEKNNLDVSTQNHHPNYSNNFKLRKSFYGRPCSRQTSFTYDMNHEKFTPCDYSNEYYRRDINDNSVSPSFDPQEYYEIEFRNDNLVNVLRQHEGKNVIKPPPRRRRRNKEAMRKISTCTDITEFGPNSLDSELNQENWKNIRNMELNDLDQRKCINYDRDNENNINIHENYNINKKSGCSNIEVVSDSLEPNQIMHSSNLSSVNDLDKLNNYDTNSMDYCENKVYYKNSGFDKYGNYKHDSDSDEVIICESIVASIDQSRSEDEVPDNSTYTKFYTDSFYHDKVDGNNSSSSSDTPFEHIKRLKSETNMILRSPFSRLRVKRSSTRMIGQNQCSVLKQQKRTRHESLTRDFCGFIPIHQITESFMNRTTSLSRKQNPNPAIVGMKHTGLRKKESINIAATRKYNSKCDSFGESFDSGYPYSSTDRCDL